MNDHSSATPKHEYKPTIIENRLLIKRLLAQIAFLHDELKQTWVQCGKDPVKFGRRLWREVFDGLKHRLATSPALPSTMIAMLVVVFVSLTLIYIQQARQKPENKNESSPEILLLDVVLPPESGEKSHAGSHGPGRVGFHENKGEGSGESSKLSQGGGGGGDRDSAPSQSGKLPPRSTIAAAIPTAPPVRPPALPVAGIDIDPALWKDLKAPVYGDPRATSETQSKGPGEGEGIGSNVGPGISEGIGPGFGPGRDGNTGGGSRQFGCCGPGSGSDDQNRTFSGSEVEQRARLLFKPEPQYTEAARRNRITGTVIIRAVFSSGGEVVQIRTLRTLPFGLTEKAIAAARQIKFVPAIKNGRPVSVFMQLEYNFNLY